MINRNIKINMNEDDMANGWKMPRMFAPAAKRNSVPNNQPPTTNVRWPRPLHHSKVANSQSQYCPTLTQIEGPNFRGGLQRQQQTNSTHAIRTVQSTLICHPKPIKVTKGGHPPFGEDDLGNCDINSRLNRQQRFIDSDARDFTRELEDRIEADLEVENIFKDVPQARSLSLGKSLPERPGNPIVKDKLFKKEEVNSQPVDTDSKRHFPIHTKGQKTHFDNRECSIEREKRILQEDFEAENEIHELLLSPEPHQNQSPTSDSLSSSSEMSSLEGEFANLEQFGLIQHA